MDGWREEVEVDVRVISGEGVGNIFLGDAVAEAKLASVRLLTEKIGTKERTQEINNTGPIILNSFFAPSVTVGILNNPKSAPAK